MRPVEDIEIISIHDYIKHKSGWEPNKKNRYLKNIERQISKPKSSNFRPIFTVMAKSGEVYQRGEQDPSLNSERPRCIFNPSENACGILVYIQKYIFEDLKSVGRNGLVVEPAFIHGLNSQGLKD